MGHNTDKPMRVLKPGTKVEDLVTHQVGMVSYTLLLCSDVVINIGGMAVRRRRNQVRKLTNA